MPKKLATKLKISAHDMYIHTHTCICVHKQEVHKATQQRQTHTLNIHVHVNLVIETRQCKVPTNEDIYCLTMKKKSYVRRDSNL